MSAQTRRYVLYAFLALVLALIAGTELGRVA